jgi:hypothetical protein
LGYQESTRQPVPGNEVRKGKICANAENRNTWRISTIEFTIIVPDWVNRMEGILLLMGKNQDPVLQSCFSLRMTGITEKILCHDIDICTKICCVDVMYENP